MRLSYFLPIVIAGAAAGAVLALIYSIARDLIRIKRGKVTCIYCKKAAVKISQHEYLFLIPVRFGRKYNGAEGYYSVNVGHDYAKKFLLAHMRAIRDKTQIPTGQRACRVGIFCCGKCGRKLVAVRDFLLVRGEEYKEGLYVFDFESFQHLLDD